MSTAVEYQPHRTFCSVPDKERAHLYFPPSCIVQMCMKLGRLSIGLVPAFLINPFLPLSLFPQCCSIPVPSGKVLSYPALSPLRRLPAFLQSVLKARQFPSPCSFHPARLSLFPPFYSLECYLVPSLRSNLSEPHP